MNAGTRDTEMFERLVSVTVVDESGEIRVLARDQTQPKYRNGGFGKMIVVQATFELEKDDPSAIFARMDVSLRRRNATQPVTQKSAGCVFQNPEGHAAGRLIEEAGCKALRQARELLRQRGGRHEPGLPGPRAGREGSRRGEVRCGPLPRGQDLGWVGGASTDSCFGSQPVDARSDSQTGEKNDVPTNLGDRRAHALRVADQLCQHCQQHHRLGDRSRCGASRSGLRSEAPWQRLWAVRTDRVSFRRITRTPRAVLGRERGGVLPRQQRPSVKGGLDFRDLTSEFAA